MWLVVTFTTEEASSVTPYLDHRSAKLAFSSFVDSVINDGDMEGLELPTWNFHDQSQWTSDNGYDVTEDYIYHAKRIGLFWVLTPNGVAYAQLIKAEHGVTKVF